VTAVLLSFLLAAPSDPEELIRQVALYYADLHEFVLQDRETRMAQGGISEPVRKTLAAAPGSKLMLEVDGATKYRIVSDGERVRSFEVGSRNYLEEDLGGSAHHEMDAELQSLVKRFSMLGRIATSARLLRTGKVKVQSRQVKCAVIEVAVESSVGPSWRETLWVDPERLSILRSDLLSGSLRTYREFLLPPGMQAPGPSLFVFIPRKDGRRLPSQPFPSRRSFKDRNPPVVGGFYFLRRDSIHTAAIPLPNNAKLPGSGVFEIVSCPGP